MLKKFFKISINMPFPNKGENHFLGVNNEKENVEFLNKTPDNIINKTIEKNHGSKVKFLKHEGGTKQKKDASVHLENGKIIGVSIKRHKSGTFDWENTTKGVPTEVKENIEEFKKTNMDKPIPAKGGIRDELAEICSKSLEKMTSKQIQEILSKIYETEDNTNYIIINDMKNKRLIMFGKSNLDPYFNPKHKHTYILKSSPRAKTSRQIWIRSSDGCEEINTNLRIRLVLNNGITALLGKSKKNKTSVPSLKIQQDNVDKFIEKCFGKVICNY